MFNSGNFPASEEKFVRKVLVKDTRADFFQQFVKNLIGDSRPGKRAALPSASLPPEASRADTDSTFDGT